MEGILRGIPHVSVYIDDILVICETDEHLRNLDEVFTRLENENLRLKREKCAFMLPKIDYLGRIISANGLQPSPTKIKAIQDAPAPRNVSQLRSFLGMVNYYGKFLHQLSTLLAPLYQLLQQRSRWHWGKEQQDVFTHVKQQLTSQPLVHFDPQEKLLSCDASPYGIRSVLSRDGGWIRKNDCICFSYLGASRKEVCTDRKGRSSHHLRCKKGFISISTGDISPSIPIAARLSTCLVRTSLFPPLLQQEYVGHLHYVLMTTVSPTNLEKNMQMLIF